MGIRRAAEVKNFYYASIFPMSQSKNIILSRIIDEYQKAKNRARPTAGCVLASPGHPGVYPPNRRCKYLVTTSSIRTRVNLTFTSLLLPYNHCETDYIAVYKGSTTSSPLLTKICGSRKSQVEYSGPNMLIEFSSGPPIPPYDYNGFVARLEFIEVPEETTITETSVRAPTKTTEPGLLMDENSSMPRRIPNTVCDFIYFGNATRSGHFDSRTKGWLQIPSEPHSPSSSPTPITCKLVFYGRNSDVVHISLFNYDLRAASCESSIEVFDGKMGKNGKCIQKICSPVTRYARDQSGRVAHYSWARRGFGFKANYKFEDENPCGERVKTEPS
ncbi:hypothetical protein J437_LFUL003918, partial [Ladona fulva]